MKKLLLIFLLLATGESKPEGLSVKQRNMYAAVSAAAVGVLTTACLYFNKTELSKEKLLAIELVHKLNGLKFDEAKYIQPIKIKYATRCFIAGLCAAAATGTIVFFVANSYLKIPKSIPKIPKNSQKHPKKLGYLPDVEGFIDFLEKEFAPILPVIKIIL